jgi:hypothetical protein
MFPEIIKDVVGKADGMIIALPRWRGFAIRAFTEMFSTMIMKLVLGHTAKIKNSSNPALFKIIAMNAVGTDYKFYLTEMLAT